MKDLIAILSYHPTLEQEDMLRNLVNNISNLNKDFDIMISSHSYIPKDICDKVDYVIYDKENKILSEDKYRAQLWVNLNNNIKVYTQYVGNINGGAFNTTLTAFKLHCMACSFSKSVGYEKIHIIEYDTSINSLNELEENSKLLNEYDSIFYSDLIENPNLNGLKSISGMFQSSNLKSLIPLLSSYNENNIMDYYINNNKNIPEILRHLAEIENGNKIYYKNVSLLTSNDIQTGLVKRSEDNWYVPFYDNPSNELRFLVRKNIPNTKNPKVELLINYNQYIKLDLPQGLTYWYHQSLINYNDINYLKVVVNDNFLYEIDFTKKDKNQWKSMNFCEDINYE